MASNAYVFFIVSRFRSKLQLNAMENAHEKLNSDCFDATKILKLYKGTFNKKNNYHATPFKVRNVSKNCYFVG